MFTWNFQYISKSRLAESFSQLMLNSQMGDILIRIHTAIHLEDEAVDLAKFIKKMVPGAHIVGTSTSAVIGWGKMMSNQCVVSVTQMSDGYVRSAMVPFSDEYGYNYSPEKLCEDIKGAVITGDTKLMLTFLTSRYLDICQFVDKSNEVYPGVKMIGGIANRLAPGLDEKFIDGFVFNEEGYSYNSAIVAAIGGDDTEALASYATGAQPIGEERVITETKGETIISIDGKDACSEYLADVGNTNIDKRDLAGLLPYVYSDKDDVPIILTYDPDEKRVWAFHRADPGRKIRRAFIYDSKVIADNRVLFLRIENFSKPETVFGYSCSLRAKMYPNSVKWELSAYENSNMCGCITNGEIVNSDGKNLYANCLFCVAVAGEHPANQEYNPYVFSYTDSLAKDNRMLLAYIADLQSDIDAGNLESVRLLDLLEEYKRRLFYSESEEYANAAALNMDMKVKGYDRVGMINVADIPSMKAVFSESLLELTYRNYLKKCESFAFENDYRFYVIENWLVAIAAPSYLTSLKKFVSDMEKLQHQLFEATEYFVAVVPTVCVIDDCTVDNVYDSYSSARVEMALKNTQFLLTKAESSVLDADMIKERYHIVNVINYALTHDGVKPYFQGIYDNKHKCIHHYEALMRLEDENGNILCPASFLDVARNFGLLYDSVSRVMIRKVLEKFRTLADVTVSINMGIRDIKNHDLVQDIYEYLQTSDHPENFIFEILENEDVDDYNLINNFVDKIHDLGAKIAIDDFGTGFSNLQHILSINMDYLKIDGSIIKGCSGNNASEKLVALITSWKHLGSRKFKIIAEYVESAEIQKVIEKYRIDYSQGYYFARPEPDIVEIPLTELEGEAVNG